jgi:CheY-like chemotaxis protein
LVEDEQILREVIETMLTLDGYQVLVADGPTMALQRAGAYSRKIHLLITEVMLAGMNGRALADKLKQMRADMRVLFISGYRHDALLHRKTLQADDCFLQKPFDRESLNRKIREALRKT